MKPSSSTTMDSTVAKTGRRMQTSGRVTRSALLLRAVVHGWLGGGGGRRVGELHRDPLAQLDHSRGHDDVRGREAVHHLHLAVAARADLDLLALRLAVHDLVDVLVVAHREERFLRDYERVLRATGEEPHAREH